MTADVGLQGVSPEERRTSGKALGPPFVRGSRSVATDVGPEAACAGGGQAAVDVAALGPVMAMSSVVLAVLVVVSAVAV